MTTHRVSYMINGKREEFELKINEEPTMAEKARQKGMDLAYGEIDVRYKGVAHSVTPWMFKIDDKVFSTWETLTMIWADVHRLLGRRYEGPQDDPLIITRLKVLGIAPEWLDDEETRIRTDVYGWEAISPEWLA